MKCKLCGREISKDDKVCPHCKAAIKEPEPKKVRKDEEE